MRQIILIVVVFIILISTQTSVPNKETNIAPKISQGEVSDIAFKLPDGFTIHTFAKGLTNPRVLQFSPGGTLLVSNPSLDLVYALPDKNNDGVADSKKVIISKEDHVHGLAFYKDKLYIADVNKVVRYTWDEEKLEATKDKVLFSLPENNNHNNRTITFNKSGQMFISLGSTCNVCLQPSEQGGSVLISNTDGENLKVFATGLRNAAFIKINPNTGELWGTEMGRDLLGDNLPPDELNIIREGKNYGWPNCYADKIPDTNFNPKVSESSCQDTEIPIFKIPAHNAPLGLLFIDSSQFPESWQGDLLVALHGSWNRSIPDGYKIVHLKVNRNNILNSEDFLTGFLQGSTVLARPADLSFDEAGNLYLSDDKSGNIFIIQKI